MPISFPALAGLFYNRKGDPAAEQRRLLEDRQRIERQLEEIERSDRQKLRSKLKSRVAPNSVQYLPTPAPPEGVRHVSWSDGYNSSRATRDSETISDIMPPRISLAAKRRNAMGHKAHRKSLMQGILSVASGEGKTPTVELKQGKKLPGYLTNDPECDTYKFPGCAYKALPDPDEFYEKGTYIVVNQQETTFRFSESKSLFLFDQNSKVRQFCINLFIRPLFSHFIMLVILANCACMILAEPPPWIENYLEYVFTAIYCFEAMIKITGMGFVLHRFAYLRDPWNWLDFIVIVFALLTEVLKAFSDSFGQFSVLRAFRVLRALKTMSVVPGLRGIVKALLRSIRALQDAVVLTIFCVSVFALVGYQLFSGTLRNKCVLIPGTLLDGPDAMYSTNWATREYDQSINFLPVTTLPSFNSNFTSNTVFNNSVYNNYDDRHFPFPFESTPLYNTLCQGLPGNFAERNNFFGSLLWNEMDINITQSIFDRINTTMTYKYESVDTKTKTHENLKCSHLLQQCLVREKFDVRTTSDSSLLRMATYTSSKTSNLIDHWNCEISSDATTDPVPTTNYPTTFTYASRTSTTYTNLTETAYNCNVTIETVAANITCLYGQLGLERGHPNATVDMTSHHCFGNSTWIDTLLFGNEFISRWDARKSIAFFTVAPISYEDSFNNNSLIQDPKTYFNEEQTFLIFGEFTREEMPYDVEKEWDCDHDNHVMRNIDAGMYFYLNSSNRPDQEPLYCTIGSNSVCPAAYECRQAGGNPDFGYTNFDHFFWAFLTSFRLIAQDAWSRLFYLTLHTIGKTYVIFYIIVMFLGSYYLINLILAVVYMAYEEQQAVVEDEEIEEEENKAELRELEASSDDNNSRSQDDECGSRCSDRSVYGTEENSRRVGLITTSLTSIADSGGLRHRRQGSRRSRYGHRRPAAPITKQSATLYRRFTRKHGDGLSRDSLDDIPSESDDHSHSRRRIRQDSWASESSYETSEHSTCSWCHGSRDNSRPHSFTTRPNRPPCQHRHPSSSFECTGSGPVSTENKMASIENENNISSADQQVTFIVTPETPLEEQVEYPGFHSSTHPLPVGTKFKKDKLDVIDVDFAVGRSLSIYSSGSDVFNKFNDSLTSRPTYCEECRRKQKLPLSRTVSDNTPTILLDPSSLRTCPERAESGNDVRRLSINYDRGSHISYSTSSTSGMFEPTEQVVQAEISPTTHWLSPPSPKSSNSSSSSSSSPTCSQTSMVNRTPGSTKSPHNKPTPKPQFTPLHVPSLLVTSASSEHIVGALKACDDQKESVSESITDCQSQHCLPGAVDGLLDLKNANNCGDNVSTNLTQNGTDKKQNADNADLKRQKWRDHKRRRKAISQSSPDIDQAVESLFGGRNGASAFHNHDNHRRITGQYDVPDVTSTNREDQENYEMLLMNGGFDKAALTACEKSSKKRERKPLKRVLRRYYVRAKRNFISIFCKWSCCTPQWMKFQSKVRCFVLDPFMDLFITLCIFLNTLFMMAEYHPMDSSYENLLETANLVFTVIFAFEMMLKVLGLGPHTYFREAWNVFDAVVVISSLLEIVLKTIPGLSVLRTFRLMRILKLAKSWPTLNKLLRIIGRTLGKLWHLTLVFLLVLFIFAVVGMQLLREKYRNKFGDNMPRWNFVDFPHAFMVVFRIQCGEWIENMFTCMNVESAGICIPLFITVLIIGNLVILNLFLALLLNSFGGDALQRTDAEQNSLAEAGQRILRWFRSLRNALRRCRVVSHCCSKIQLQLCLDEETTTTKKKEKRKKKDQFAIEASPSTQAIVLSDLDSEMQRTNNNCNYDEKEAHGDEDESSTVKQEKINGETEKYKTADFIEIPNGIGEHPKQHRHRTRRKDRHNPRSYSTNDDSLSPTRRVHSSDRTTYGTTVKCHGCRKNCVTVSPVNKRRRHRKKREGFAPAAAFQNRTDTQNDPSTSSNRDDVDISRPPRHAFKGCDPIEYRRTVSHDRDSRHSKEDLIDDVGISSHHHERRHKSTSSSKRSHIPEPVTIEADDGHTKYSGAEETDILLIGRGSRRPSTAPSSKQPSLKNGNAGRSGRKKSNSSGKSVSNSLGSARSRQSLDRSESNGGEKEEQKGEEEKKEPKIVQCFPPCWTHSTDGKFWAIRKVFYNIAEHQYFKNLVIFCILLSSIALALEDIHLPKRPALEKTLYVFDKFFCFIFTVEMLIKWIGLGIRYYFTNAWCLLDFFIVFFSLLDLSLSLTGGATEQLGALRVLRTFRALRPLRALSRFQGMKVVVDALVRAIPSIFHVFLVCVIVWLIFSILGVNLFGGRFGRCVMFTGSSGVILPRPNYSSFDNVTLELSEMCLPNMTFPLNSSAIPHVRNKDECIECARLMDTDKIKWVIPSVNFDNVGQGFLALMQVATFKGWLEIMANAIDIVGIEEQPSYENAFFNYVYFCIFIVFGAFFSLNLFIGVIIDNFNQQKVKCADGEDGVFLTDEQKRYYNAMKRMAAKTPSRPIPRPDNWFSDKIYDIVTDRKFEMGVMAMILLNMIVMAVEHYDMSQEMDNVLQHFNLVFICIFVVEAVLKLIGLRHHYFKVPWNIFDIIVVLVSVIASALSDAIEKYFVQPTLFRIIRLFRVTRILRLIREAKGIRTLLFALMMSIPALFNIGSLLFLVIFIYAILGMSQFAYIQKTGGVDDLLNFETFPNSFLVLFQVSTSEGWNTFIEPILHEEPPFCDPTLKTGGGNGNCGNATVGVAYFVTFVLITFLIVINMYIAIILENFEVATRESSEPLTADDFEQFFEVWQRYDDRLSQFITFEQLQHFLHHLDFPLRVPFPNRAFIANARMRITPNGKIHCLEVIIALIKKVLGDSPELDTFKADMLESFMLKCRTKEPIEEEETIDTMEFAQRRRSAMIIQSAFRKFRTTDRPRRSPSSSTTSVSVTDDDVTDDK